jgi:sulfonate transport system substrate-binding protein
MKPIKSIVAIFLVCAIGTAVYLVSKYNPTHRQDEPPLQSVTIATFSKALGNSPYYIARHFKWFEEDPALKGVNFIYKEYTDRPSISDAFSSGDLQVLFSAEVPSILCRAQGNDIRIVTLSANVAQNILVRKELPINSVSDLRGNKLAVLQGTSSHYGLLKILNAAGLKETDLQLLYMSPAEAKAAFESDKIDAWAVWAPFVEQQEVSGKGRLVVGGDAVIDSAVSISASFLKQHELAARAIVTAIHKAKKWMVEHPEEAQKIATQELGLDPEVVKVAWPKHNWAARLNEAMIDDIQAKATFMAEMDKTRQSKKLDVRKELIDLRFATTEPQ